MREQIEKILTERGESLLGDDSVDKEVARSIADGIMEILRQCEVKIIVRTEDGYWGSGKDIETALARIYDSGGRGQAVAVINAYIGSKEALSGTEINSYGDISYPQSCAGIRIGKASVKISRQEEE